MNKKEEISNRMEAIKHSSAGIYEEGFIEFLEEAIEAEKRRRFRVAVSNYYKALTEMCSYIIITQLQRQPTNHKEVFLFLKASFPEMSRMVDPLFDIYRRSYYSENNEEDCRKIKDGIKKIAQSKGISEKIRKAAEKI